MRSSQYLRCFDKKHSRFGRDTVETLSAINRLRVAGVRIIFEQENLDTDEVDSNLMISVMESLTQAENESQSEKIRMKLAMRAVNGTPGRYKRKVTATQRIRMKSL